MYEVFVTVDREIRDSIYAKQEILSNDTISLTNSLYLQRGMAINVLITSSKHHVFTISAESRVSIIMLGKCSQQSTVGRTVKALLSLLNSETPEIGLKESRCL